MLSAIINAEQNGVQQRKLISRGHQVSEELPTLAPDAVRSILMTLVNRWTNRYSWTKNQRSLFVSRTRPRVRRRKTSN